MIFSRQDAYDLMQLCGRTAAINDSEITGQDFEYVKNALQTIISIHKIKIDDCKEHFISGYLAELSSRPYENPSIEIAEAAYESIMRDIYTN